MQNCVNWNCVKQNPLYYKKWIASFILGGLSVYDRQTGYFDIGASNLASSWLLAKKLPWKNYRIWINTFQAIRVYRLFKSIPIQKSDYTFKYIWFPSLDLDSKWWKKNEIRITNKYSTQCKIWIKKTSINLMWFELISSIWFELAKTFLCLKNVHYHNSRLYNSFWRGSLEYL